MAKPRPSSRTYDYAWQVTRRRILATHPACAHHCGRRAVEVHHKQPLSEGGSRLDPANLEPLCRPCHRTITNQLLTKQNNPWSPRSTPRRIRNGAIRLD